MKQMRSRFRLITLLLTCFFLLTLVLCAGRALKTAGITLDSLPLYPVISGLSSPDVSVSPAVEPTPGPSEPLPDASAFPETDNSPDPEYNIFGL